MTPIVSIITITMNHLAYIKDMLNSLFTTGKPSIPFEIIIVDNCSLDGTREYIESQYPDIKLIKNKKIYGFAENNNIGVSHATGKYTLILNPDIIVMPHSIDKLYQFAEANPACGIIAPKLLNTNGTLQYSARHFLSPKILFQRIVTGGDDKSNIKGTRYYLMKDISMEQPTDVDWCMGAALLLRRAFYEELNGFDPKFFLYVEDMDICHRCWQKGKRVTYYPLSAFVHVHKRDSRTLSKKTWIHLRSFLYFLRKNKFNVIAHPTP